MERRKFLIGAGSTAIGASALVGSGAFSSVDAERGVTVETAADNDAYLALSSDNEYVTDDGDSGTLTIDLGGPTNSDSYTGQGLNDDALTVLNAVNIRNQGTKEVTLSVDDSNLDESVAAEIPGTFTLSPGEEREQAIQFTINTHKDYSSPGDLVIKAES